MKKTVKSIYFQPFTGVMYVTSILKNDRPSAHPCRAVFSPPAFGGCGWVPCNGNLRALPRPDGHPSTVGEWYWEADGLLRFRFHMKIAMKKHVYRLYIKTK